MITSGTFWALLLVSTLAFWRVPKIAPWVLLFASITHALLLAPISLALLAGGSVLFWAAGRDRPATGRPSKLAVGVAIAASVAALAYFKHARDDTFVIPLGLSYLTFRWISYAVDRVRGGRAASLHELVAYGAFFPTFAAGPIERFDPFMAGRAASLGWAEFGRGLTRIVYGLTKKLVIVDVVMARKDHGEGLFARIWAPPSLDRIVDHTASIAPSAVWQFAADALLRTYLEFSAYSDIAIGAALLVGHRIVENFDYPLLATSPSDFWRRWHVSLSGFCQRYVYMPAMIRTRSPYVAVFAAMLVMGLWHDATWNLVAWGVYHAAVLALSQALGRLTRARGLRFDRPAFTVLGWALTMAAVVPGCAFMSTTGRGLHAGLQVFLRLFGATLS